MPRSQAMEPEEAIHLMFVLPNPCISILLGSTITNITVQKDYYRDDPLDHTISHVYTRGCRSSKSCFLTIPLTSTQRQMMSKIIQWRPDLFNPLLHGRRSRRRQLSHKLLCSVKEVDDVVAVVVGWNRIQGAQRDLLKSWPKLVHFQSTIRFHNSLLN